MNRDKHIWEGWTVGDFIDDIEPMFNMCAPFHDKQSLKRWVAQEQPYYKKHIPEVYNYFLKNQDYNGNKITNKNYTTSRRLSV